MTAPSEGIRLPEDRAGRTIWVLVFAGIVTTLMSTLVIPLLGELPAILGTSPANASWVVTVTLLAGAVATPVTGRLGDMYGARRILLLCTIPLIVGSFVCAMSSSLWPMLIGRALQGAGFGIVPLGISALRSLVPPERLGSAIALMSSSLGIGGALGLPVAAIVAQTTSWRMLFWGVGILSVVMTLLIAWFVREAPVRETRGRFDGFGAVGLAVALVCLLLAVSKGGDWGWTAVTTVTLFVVSLVVFLGWGRWELRTGSPLVDLRVAMGNRVLVTNIVTILIGFSMYFQALLVPQIRLLPESTGYGLGQSMIVMGLWCAPAGLLMMAISPLGARLTTLRGPRTTLCTGCLMMAVAYGSSVVLMGSTWGLLVITCSIAAGIGLAYGAIPTLLMGAVPRTEVSSANSVNTLLRSLGGTVSAAVAGVVLAQMSVAFAGNLIPTENGFLVGMLIGGASALLAALATVGIRGEQPSVPGTPPVAGPVLSQPDTAPRPAATDRVVG
ncbi:MFS transporter [Rhodococcus coprophilus]|uniref:Major facilitator superfamily multidrug resistance protein n=1 Tax=Rhodococcus coprophilus TaxID=38310 RepID=A0A2X4U7C3_9NOCA|nr:MFS transporter [Rhodococcus coprophilus]MBM7459271.1 MFS family permease [Rhodococcus coprophilus]SQI35706.1 major facilitator superfamily multidrug resistance protein [Rhodococcus coprophilus]